MTNLNVQSVPRWLKTWPEAARHILGEKCEEAKEAFADPEKFCEDYTDKEKCKQSISRQVENYSKLLQRANSGKKDPIAADLKKPPPGYSENNINFKGRDPVCEMMESPDAQAPVKDDILPVDIISNELTKKTKQAVKRAEKLFDNLIEIKLKKEANLLKQAIATAENAAKGDSESEAKQALSILISFQERYQKKYDDAVKKVKEKKAAKVTLKKEPKKIKTRIEEKTFWDNLAWKVEGKTGYSGVSGKPGVFSDRPRGIILDLEFGATWLATENWASGANYLFKGPIDPRSDGKVVYASDHGGIFGEYGRKNLKIHLELGATYYNNDRPTPLCPNKFVATQDLSLKWRFIPLLSGNLGLSFEQGKAGINEAMKEDYFKSEAFPSLSFHLLDNSLVPALGAFVSYDNLADSLPWGVFAGAKYDLGVMEIGLDAMFTDYPQSKKYVEDWRIDSKLGLKLTLWKNLKLSFFGGLMYGKTKEETKDDSVLGWGAGLGLGWEGIKK